MGSDHAGASCWSKQTQNQKWVNRTRHQFRSPSARPVCERFLSFYFLCSNPVIEPVHHFPLSLEGKLVSAVEKQRVEPLRLADRLIGLTQAVNGSLNPVGRKQAVLLSVDHEERARHRQRADVRIVQVFEQTRDHPRGKRVNIVVRDQVEERGHQSYHARRFNPRLTSGGNEATPYCGYNPRSCCG